MKRNVSIVKLCLYVSECVCSKIIKELPGLVGSGTPYIILLLYCVVLYCIILYCIVLRCIVLYYIIFTSLTSFVSN